MDKRYSYQAEAPDGTKPVRGSNSEAYRYGVIAQLAGQPWELRRLCLNAYVAHRTALALQEGGRKTRVVRVHLTGVLSG